MVDRTLNTFVPRALLVLACSAGCTRDGGVADTSSATYAEATVLFYRGVAAAQVGETSIAAASFQRFVELAPDEPAGWADLALVALQRRELEDAVAHVERARRLAPENARVLLLAAVIARERGQHDEARELLQQASARDSLEPRGLYLAAELTEQQDRQRARTLIERILVAQPDNRAAWLETARHAAAAGDTPAVSRSLDQLERALPDLPAEAAAELRAVREAVAAGNASDAGTQLAFLDATLQQVAAYREDREALTFRTGYADLLLTRFLSLPSPPLLAAAADPELAFTPAPLVAGEGAAPWVRAVWLSEDVPSAVMAARPDSLWIGTEADWFQILALPGSASGHAVAAAFDYDFDFRVDLALAGSTGLRLYHQENDGTFADVSESAFPANVREGAYAGVWAADLDMEGDLDLILGVAAGPTVALMNRGDGSFERWQVFEDIVSLRDFAWADLDGDGTPDAALLSSDGRLHVRLNARSAVPRFRTVEIPVSLGPVRAIAAADVDRDGRIDLGLLLSDGRVMLLSRGDTDWRAQQLAELPAAPADTNGARLFFADLDNNGQLDIVASAAARTSIWLNTPDGEFRAGPAVQTHITDVADLSGDARLDLLGVAANGAPEWLENRGSRDYFAVTLQPRAAAEGDRRINAFGAGGEVEMRAGLLYQKQPIQSPSVHFGLGEHARADVARILWPNGTLQAEFNVSALNRAAVARQRLKGSCPWVFAYDGQAMRFVTDFLWRTALGLRINAQGDAAVIHSEDWIRIGGDQLVERDGFYDIRITAELWETHFFDHVSLLAVDHPAGTDLFVDERFTLPAPEPSVRAFSPPRPLSAALDHKGRDVSEALRELDGRYADSFALGPYQGIAEEHFVELDLTAAPADASLWLIAQGWVYPTDSSINLAVGQAGGITPRGLQLEAADGQGGWRVVREDLGFPAGKTKTILIDLRDAFLAGAPRRVRLRTNMEIYWDRITWSELRADAGVETQKLLPAVADLRYRGFSAVTQASRRAPELPDYERIAAASPQWLDLVGYHTRLGDVRPLLGAVDDRYVIMNAGDELVLRFPALPAPAAGTTRTFVLIGDGWVKDGDFNTGFSRTVLPLPYHGLGGYNIEPGRLQDDPAYLRHPKDWKEFHTRFVTPHGFQRALVPDS